MEICQSAVRVGVGDRGQGGTCQLQKLNQIWEAVWEDWEEESNHSLRSDREHDGLGGGEGSGWQASGKRKKKVKGKNSKGGGRRWMKKAVIWNVDGKRLGAGGAGLDLNTISHWSTFAHLSAKHTYGHACHPQLHLTPQPGLENIRVGPSAAMELPQKHLV